MAPHPAPIGDRFSIREALLMARFHVAGFLLVALLATGCGGERLVKVTGTATRNGKPVPNVAVNFLPEKGLRSVALTDQNGKFKLVHLNGREGALVGTHKVVIQLPTAGARNDPEHQKRLALQQSDPEITQILEKYGDAERTPITVEVTESKDINLALD
jgi:hypothetical protein